jgi:hypothetical protein
MEVCPGFQVEWRLTNSSAKSYGKKNDLRASRFYVCVAGMGAGYRWNQGVLPAMRR